MSTEYHLISGPTYSLELEEHSSVVDIYISSIFKNIIIAQNLDAEQLCELAEKIIKVASYIVTDPNVILDKYNVRY